MQNVDYKQKYEKYKLRYLEAKKFLQSAGQKPVEQKPVEQLNVQQPNIESVMKQAEEMKNQYQISQIEDAMKNKIMEMFGNISNQILKNDIVNKLKSQVQGMQSGGAYSEEKRGFNSDKVEDKEYPPCFRICGASRAMHDDLKELGLLEKYKDLMNLHSMTLCTEIDVRDNGKDCILSIKPRLEEIKAKPTTTANKHVKKIFEDMGRSRMLENMAKNNHPVDQHTLAIMNHVAENANAHVAKLMKESKVTKEAAKNFENLNNVFYKVHFRQIAKACNPMKDQYTMNTPADKKDAAKKPAAKKPAAKKTAAKKPAAKKPAAKKTAAKKPAKKASAKKKK